MPNAITESVSSSAPQNRRDTVKGPASKSTPAGEQSPVIELRVRNHPGAMSHITGLFARRAFNLEAIACAPVGNGTESRMLLLVGNDARLEQVEHQLAKLYDVLSVRHREDIGPEFFSRICAV